MPGMILLEEGNRILEETVRSIVNDFKAGESKACDVRLYDFDDVSYHIQKTDTPIMKISMGMPSFRETADKGCQAALDATYGKYVVEAEVSHDVTLDIPLDGIADDEQEKLIKDLATFKSTVAGGVYDSYFTALAEGNSLTDKLKFDQRSDTTVYMVPKNDRVVVIFEVYFDEEVDREIGSVFMQEFKNCRTVRNNPPMGFSKNPPRELSEHFGITENDKTELLGYVSFAVLPSHVKKNKAQCINTLQSFRNFLQYHIKCSKSVFHSKMRKRVVELIKVLNRAKIDDEKKEKKTVGGKTFKRG